MSAPDEAVQRTANPPPIPLPPIPLPSPSGDAVLQGGILTKLRILDRCHQAVSRAQRKFLTVLLGLLVGVPLGILAGVGTYYLIYEDPFRHTQRYYGTLGGIEHFVKGTRVSQQEYDYFLAQGENRHEASIAAVGVGLGACAAVVLAFLVTKQFRNRPLYRALDEQVAAILKEHPEAVQAWGGPLVLRQPELVQEVLVLVESGKAPAG
jgi:hypothetical protein